jgi:hypothetical protein
MRKQSEARDVYVRLALGPPHHPGYMADRSREFVRLLPSLWSLPWENNQKEVLWRLATDGVQGVNSRLPFECPCCLVLSPACDPRLHCFWECPVALAVRAALQATLATLTTQPIHRASLWLCAPRPSPTLDAEVWRVVCLAALSAMDHGRRQGWRLKYAADAAALPGPRQSTLHEVWGLPPPPGVETRSIPDRAAALAVADFWVRIADFVATDAPPPEWADRVHATHPFISHGGSRVNMGAPSPSHIPPPSPPPGFQDPPASSSPSPLPQPVGPATTPIHRRLSQLTLPAGWSHA